VSFARFARSKSASRLGWAANAASTDTSSQKDLHHPG
jgi:hypothetical protein